MKIDFNGVEAPKNVERVAKVIEPGVQELVITDMQLGTAATGTAFVEVHLNKPENPVEYPLKERFYVSPKARWRLLAFLEGALNRSFEGVEVDTDQLRPELLNKRNTYVVDGEEYLKPNPDGGQPYVNTRAKLASFTFINPPAGVVHKVAKLDVAPNSATSTPPTENTQKEGDDDLPF